MAASKHQHAAPADPNDPAIKKKAEGLISQGRAIAKKICPYFRPMLHTLVVREDVEHPTCYVTDRAIMGYNPAFIARQTPKKVAGLFIHETLHLWNKHGGRRKGREARKWNKNCDRAINPSVLEVGLELPDGPDKGCFPEDLKDATGRAAARGLAAEEYFRLDLEPEGSGGGSRGSQGGSGDEDGQGEGAGQPGAGDCGSCAGNPSDGEPGADDPDARPPSDLARAARATSELVREAGQQQGGRGQGRLPADWLQLAEATLQPARVPWRQKLRYSLREGVGHVVGQVTHRFDRPSRRQAAIGYGPGKAVLPRLRAPIPNVLVVLDTSGSMTGKPLQDATIEINGILKAVGARVTFCVCDAQVHGIKPVENVKQALSMMAGGGGTDFRPAFDAAEKLNPRPEIIVFLTDGMGAFPKLAPTYCKTIFVLISEYGKQTPPWGTIIDVDDKGSREIDANKNNDGED